MLNRVTNYVAELGQFSDLYCIEYSCFMEAAVNGFCYCAISSNVSFWQKNNLQAISKQKLDKHVNI